MIKNLELRWQIIAVLAIGVLAFWVASTLRTTYGSAPSGLSASYATSSTLAVGPNYVQVLTTAQPNCAARVVSTAATAIRLSFGGESATSTATSTSQISSSIGTLQAASTTVVYDGGLYGCGFVGTIGVDITTSTVHVLTTH